VAGPDPGGPHPLVSGVAMAAALAGRSLDAPDRAQAGKGHGHRPPGWRVRLAGASRPITCLKDVSPRAGLRLKALESAAPRRAYWWSGWSRSWIVPGGGLSRRMRRPGWSCRALYLCEENRHTARDCQGLRSTSRLLCLEQPCPDISPSLGDSRRDDPGSGSPPLPCRWSKRGSDAAGMAPGAALPAWPDQPGPGACPPGQCRLPLHHLHRPLAGCFAEVLVDRLGAPPGW